MNINQIYEYLFTHKKFTLLAEDTIYPMFHMLNNLYYKYKSIKTMCQYFSLSLSLLRLTSYFLPRFDNNSVQEM